MAFVTTRGGTRIHYALHGDAEDPSKIGPEPRKNAVVLVQGLGLSSRFWFDVPNRLTEGDEAGRRLVITLDNRGTGRSGRPRSRYPFLIPTWSLAEMADDVVAVLDDVNVQNALIVGISMGGMIAQHIALRHPSRVRGLVLLATSPGLFANALPEPVALYRLLSLPFGGKSASSNLAKLLLPESKWSRAREIFRDWPMAMQEDRTSPSTFVAHLLAASSHYVAPKLSSIRCPTIVVAGDSDTLIPKRNAESLARRIPGAELEVLHDTGHALFAEDRDLILRLVRRLEKRVASEVGDQRLETGSAPR